MPLRPVGFHAIRKRAAHTLNFLESLVPRWFFGIKGYTLDIQALAGFAHELNCEVSWRASHEAYICCASIADFYQSGKAIDKAKDILDQLNNMAVLNSKSHQDVVYSGHAHLIYKDGKSGVTISVPSGNIRVRPHAPRVEAGGRQEPTFEMMIAKVLQNEPFKAQLQNSLRKFREQPRTGTTLQAALEILVGRNLQNSLVKSGFAGPEEVKRFQNGVNDPALFGNASRHGIAYKGANLDGMTFVEAEEFVYRNLKKWVRSKYPELGG